MNKPQRDESFGIVPVSLIDGEWKVFLIQHKHGRYWGFPKGHAEGSETPQDAAHRELKEETHLDIVRFLYQEPLMEQYQFTYEGRRISKRVYYFLAEVSGTVILEKSEIADGAWSPLSEAREKLTHPEGKAILRQVEKMLQSLKS